MEYLDYWIDIERHKTNAAEHVRLNSAIQQETQGTVRFAGTDKLVGM